MATIENVLKFKELVDLESLISLQIISLEKLSENLDKETTKVFKGEISRYKSIRTKLKKMISSY